MSLIQCRGLTKQYGAKKALDAVDLQLEAGAPIALVGPNGAGKTTLMSLLLGFVRPSAGEISIMGHVPGSQALLGQVSALPQDAQLDPDFTLLAQFSLYARLQGYCGNAANIEAMRVLALVGLADTAQALPGSLSHGMSKRAAIAQALLGQPKLVLLDEPTAGLDPVNARSIRELVSQLADSITFMISSHNLDELEKLCGRVLYLDHGQLSQTVDLSTPDSQHYMTLQMHPCDETALLAALRQLPGIVDVSEKGKLTYLLQYQADAVASAPEIALLQLLQQHQWQYRRLLQGRSLEDKLFS